MIMNSYMISQLESFIKWCEFTDEFMHVNFDMK